jgi:hypothetical protein
MLDEGQPRLFVPAVVFGFGVGWAADFLQCYGEACGGWGYSVNRLAGHFAGGLRDLGGCGSVERDGAGDAGGETGSD